MFDTVINGIHQYQASFLLIGSISFALVILSVLLLPWLISLIPTDYFKQANTVEHDKNRLWRPINIARNLLGFLIVLAGIAMLVLPGQGALTILVGIGVMNFPGKYKLERWMITRPGVLQALNWIRQKVKRPPLEV